ncbi:MAG: hypothetical protein OEV31_01495 [Gammaproteobacteria bacterium]|nr:hypothetical protein [Gammaproteobacteria bacterium]
MPHDSAIHNHQINTLHAEIAWHEMRLMEIGEGTECAYEMALARSFEQALATRRTHLNESCAAD